MFLRLLSLDFTRTLTHAIFTSSGEASKCDDELRIESQVIILMEQYCMKLKTWSVRPLQSLDAASSHSQGRILRIPQRRGLIS